MTAVLPRASKRRLNVLPAEVTSFVGRRHELAEVKRLLAASRLVTLTGVGGVGKTRLALRVAAEVRRIFPDGVWLVELAELENPKLLAQTVAETLEIRDYYSRSPLEALADYLNDRHALIVLDNCEHLLIECAMFTDELVHAVPHLRILATSRQALGISSEQTLSLAPLSLPTQYLSLVSAESLVECDAVRLFTDRAVAVVPDFAVTDANREAVAAVCRRLDGIPLAIELAAVRLRVLSVEQLLRRLEDRFRLLTAGSRAALPRQRTLRALIDWSYELCTERERLLWQRVSVFAGGLDLDAAENVCAGDGIAVQSVLDLVTGLVEKSVLAREDQPGTVRYRLLETIRQYGKERLAASGQEAVMQRRHRDYYRLLSAEAHAELFGPKQVAWFSRLQREHANLRTALEYCFSEPGEAGAGLTMAVDLRYHWITGFYLGEGRRWIDLGLTMETEPTEVRGRALWAGAWLSLIQGDCGKAAAMLEESGTVADRLRNDAMRAYVALYSGMVAMCRGDPESATRLYREAADGHRAHGNPVGLALALIRLSLAYSYRGEVAQAIAAAEESLAVCEAYGEGWHQAYTKMALGIGLWKVGDSARAAELEKASLRFNRSLDDPLGAGVNLEVLAWIAACEKRYERAARLLGILETVWRAVGAPLSGFGHLVCYHKECESRVLEALGEQAFRAAVKRGARLPYDDAVAYALQDEAPSAAPRDTSAGRLAPLTRRETEIATLVAQGLSNKDIAAALVISQRTAEGHIEHILNKLGFNSRAQVAAWLSERTRST
ncbi:LuxR C-terminal-related transcriptional regulator [Planotetraspora sp. GP83]|uniref:ATP-binding protein n=1 Tax=Planotetraspora sp. GP83 TaxID=3156264 RepID=UPI0035135B7F